MEDRTTPFLAFLALLAFLAYLAWLRDRDRRISVSELDKVPV